MNQEILLAKSYKNEDENIDRKAKSCNKFSIKAHKNKLLYNSSVNGIKQSSNSDELQKDNLKIDPNSSSSNKAKNLESDNIQSGLIFDGGKERNENKTKEKTHGKDKFGYSHPFSSRSQSKINGVIIKNGMIVEEHQNEQIEERVSPQRGVEGNRKLSINSKISDIEKKSGYGSNSAYELNDPELNLSNDESISNNDSHIIKYEMLSRLNNSNMNLKLMNES
eukprot:CAMPEP_0170514022 /NCGR_PEP_ID=MMETSP0209-20121228/579_1 /TAXON_ID=665100 ORGANISM="Litonotus pictus, Strain P1" /NCGR_SAMPLE_ID=MMETSP0209 /ASSEMBLY_ACC=CAM_ASM_000301 /LENGTH=221 /DNA_ID=CAMNT_0010797921 /DNA_START=1504 /DNA_END=2169 /DNA_ORIENTATION=-